MIKQTPQESYVPRQTISIMNLRLKAAFLGIAAITAVVPAPLATAGSGSRVHTLTGVTKFTATETSSTLVRFPQDGVDFVDDFRPSFTGNGRVQGFILRKPGRRTQVIENITVGQCTKEACDSRPGFGFTTRFGGDDELSGVWELIVVADEAPVRVTFRIRGTPGRSEIQVTKSVDAEVKTLKPQVHEQNGNVVYSAGDFTKLTRADFGLVGLWVAGGAHAATAIGDCMYYDYRDEEENNPPEDFAFLPGCPTGDGYPIVAPGPDTDGGGVILTSSSLCCPSGLGAWYTTASAVERYGAVAFWIDF
jgi:hypothetical protein